MGDSGSPKKGTENYPFIIVCKKKGADHSRFTLNRTVDAEQYWCGARDRFFGPLALSFDTEVRTRLLKCDLHFPSHCKGRDDFGRLHIEVDAEERLWFPFSLGVAYQDPSECCWWSADSIPQTGLGDKLDRCFFRAIPIRWRSPCPAFVSGVQLGFEVGERLPYFSRSTSFFSREEAQKDWHQVSTG